MGTVTLSLPIPLSAAAKEEALKLIEILSGGETPAEEPKKRGRKAKNEIAEDDAEEVEEDVEEDEDAEEDDEEEDEDAEDDDVVGPEDLVKLKKALRAYSEKNSKAKAVKILNKFANASQDVKAADFGKLMKLLKV